MSEGIDWRYIEFVDNQEVLDLIEGKMGLLDLLDELCRFPSSGAADLANKYSTTPSVSTSKRYVREKRPPTAFSIDHYAGLVRYDTLNFLDKNKDYVVAEQAQVMAASGTPLLASLFTSQPAGGESGEAGGGTPGMGSRVASSSRGLNTTPAGGASAMKSFKFDRWACGLGNGQGVFTLALCSGMVVWLVAA